MHLQDFVPSPALRPFIKKYYLAEANYTSRTRDVFFADGCPEVVFNLDLDFFTSQQKDPWAKVIGQIVDPLKVQAQGKGKSFGIWFYPYGLSMICDIPMNELTDQIISAEALFPADFLAMVGDCLAYNRTGQLVQNLNTFFEKRLQAKNKASQVELTSFAVRQLYQNETATNLNQLAETCNVSPRYLQKLFLEYVGLRPKQFQRVMRFQTALQQIGDQENTDLTSIAYDSGYFDQSHFIREFKSFANLAPSRFKAENYPINKYFLQQA